MTLVTPSPEPPNSRCANRMNLSDGQKARQEKRQHVVRQIRPQMLVAGRRQQLTQIVFDHSLITDRHFARERCAYASVAVWRLVRPQPGRWLNVERFREDG